MSEELFIAVCLSSIKARKIFNFLPLVNNSVTIEFSFLLLIISTIIPSKPINILFFYQDCNN